MDNVPLEGILTYYKFAYIRPEREEIDLFISEQAQILSDKLPKLTLETLKRIFEIHESGYAYLQTWDKTLDSVFDELEDIPCTTIQLYQSFKIVILIRAIEITGRPILQPQVKQERVEELYSEFLLGTSEVILINYYRFTQLQIFIYRNLFQIYRDEIKRWNKEQEKLLLDLIHLGLDNSDIAKYLGKTPLAIKQKKARMLIPKLDIPRDWTPEKIIELQTLVNEGKSNQQIAKMLNRSYVSVKKARTKFLSSDYLLTLGIENGEYILKKTESKRITEYITIDEISEIYKEGASILYEFLIQNNLWEVIKDSLYQSKDAFEKIVKCDVLEDFFLRLPPKYIIDPKNIELSRMILMVLIFLQENLFETLLDYSNESLIALYIHIFRPSRIVQNELITRYSMSENFIIIIKTFLNSGLILSLKTKPDIWSDQEKELLRILLEKKLPQKDIAKILGRTKTSVNLKIFKLGLAES